jgi:hypothetical protein
MAVVYSNAKAFFSFNMASRWLAIRLDSVSILVVRISIVLAEASLILIIRYCGHRSVADSGCRPVWHLPAVVAGPRARGSSHGETEIQVRSEQFR